jgi:hypothetical protein
MLELEESDFWPGQVVRLIIKHHLIKRQIYSRRLVLKDINVVGECD